MLYKMCSIDPDDKVHGAHMGPTWGRQDSGGPRVGPMNFAIRGSSGEDNWRTIEKLIMYMVCLLVN